MSTAVTPDEKVPCRACARPILPATAARTSGLCMRCAPRPPVPEITLSPEEQARREALRRFVDGLPLETSDGALLAARCPCCGAGLRLSVHWRKHSFAVRCSAKSLHYMMNGHADTLPPWMHVYVDGAGLTEQYLLASPVSPIPLPTA